MEMPTSWSPKRTDCPGKRGALFLRIFFLGEWSEEPLILFGENSYPGRRELVPADAMDRCCRQGGPFQHRLGVS